MSVIEPGSREAAFAAASIRRKMESRASATLSKGDDASDMAADLSNLLRSAARLKARSRRKSERKTLPALLFLTDPGRIADPVAALTRLPRRADGHLGVVFRHFGAKNRVETAQKLKKLCARRNWILLIGADPALAAHIRADGVHLPERMAAAAQSMKHRRPNWIVTAAAHNRKALNRYENVDAFLLSTAFPSESPSVAGKKALYRRGLAGAARSTKTPLYALGGVNGKNIKSVENIRGIIGGALVSGLIDGA